ncbi:MAG: hypothetical protein NTW87_10665 [Planctomycetota bacterium]|nr:hypothetical protein [Planctomycetota bacterium]
MLRSCIANKHWEDAVLLLADLESLAVLWRDNPAEVRKAWDAIEANSTYRIEDRYRDYWLSPDARAVGMMELGELLAETEHAAEAAVIFDALIRHHRGTGDVEVLASSLDWRARLYWEAGNLDDAMSFLKEEERLCREHGDALGLAQALNNQALLLEDRCELDKAVELYRESEHLHRQASDREGLATNLCNQARLLVDRLQMDQAMALFAVVEQLGAETGSDEDLARCLLVKAEALADMERAAEALDCARRGYAAAEKIHDRRLMQALGELLTQLE